jgi:ABC-2 type transport system ATP-binding protein
LSTWAIYGENLADLSEKLQNQPGVEQTVLFGTMIHVSGKNAEMLERTLRTITSGADFRMEKMATGLEDVFIYMMKQSSNNSGAKA